MPREDHTDACRWSHLCDEAQTCIGRCHPDSLWRRGEKTECETLLVQKSGLDRVEHGGGGDDPIQRLAAAPTNSIRLGDSLAKALGKLDTMRRFADAGTLWLVISSTPPMPCAPEKAEEHKQETLAFLHYARIGLMAAHDNLSKPEPG